MNNINQEIARGAAWVLLFKVFERGLGLISFAILARLLTPADFGIVALAMTTIGALKIFTHFSFDVALIQNQQAADAHYHTAWTLNFILFSVIALAVAGLSEPLADFYDEPGLKPLFLVLAIVPFIQAAENIRVIDFRKHMRFDLDFRYRLAHKLGGFCVTIPLAFITRSYWALASGIIAAHLTSLITGYWLKPVAPRFGLAKFREMLSFTKWIFGANILYFLRQRASAFIIGKFSGMTGVGLFSNAYELSEMATTELVAPINRAVLPAQSKIAQKSDELRTNYLQVSGILAALSIPVGVGLAAVAEPAILVVMGPTWVDAIPLLAIMAPAGALGFIESNTGTTCMAAGRPDVLFKLYLFFATLLLGLVGLFSQWWGVIGAAWGVLAAVLINTPIYAAAILKVIGLPLSALLNVIWRPAIAAALMYASVAVTLGQMLVPVDTATALLPLGVGVLVGVFVYFASLTALWHFAGRPAGAEQLLLAQWQEQLVPRLKQRMARG
ncbi:MAG: lipopolysaccharide biosynthesis protein [Pseudomonadota bacterium]